ncbi:hypothetical protein [Caballeronia sp. TF1N1]|uniref:DUF7940 domain-containing protein n=1 Tax=Caballeronia sp. TF1N1 TaxID=2878153 RepID=UPI001FD36439|nr:hypothetical protein [Caballeronia sp. TF1N1]
MKTYNIILIAEWKRVWKMYSTHAFSLAMGISGGLLWLAKVHPDIYEKTPAWMLVLIGLFCGVSYGISRVVRQENLHDDASPPPEEEKS